MQISSWQSQLQRAVRDPVTLLDRLGLTAEGFSLASRSVAEFPVRVPPHYLGNIRYQDRDDPLLRQVLPLDNEDLELEGYTVDPLDEEARLAVPGILHKYYGRVLLITAGACAIHCRYCFRRHFPYPENIAAKKNWTPALDYIRNDRSITEVILSGGDPLTLDDDKLGSLISQLAEIRHLKRLRVHTRMPSVIPGRITDTLLGVLTSTRLNTLLVSHCNHPQEIDHAVTAAFERMRTAGITLLNQAVLLNRINDNAGTLITLFEQLYAGGVLPYYLHMPDKVAGAAHFDVAPDTPRTIMEELRTKLPGYLVPRLVREVPGAPYKIPVL